MNDSHYLDPDAYSRGLPPSCSQRSQTAYLRAHRFMQLARLAGVLGEPYQRTLSEFLDRNPQHRKMADGFREVGEIYAMKYGVDRAEVRFAVTPFHLKYSGA